MKDVAKAKRSESTRAGRGARPQVAMEERRKPPRGARKGSAEPRPVVETSIPKVNPTTDDKVEGELEPGDTMVTRKRVPPQHGRPVPVESKKPSKPSGGAGIDFERGMLKMGVRERSARGRATVPRIVRVESDERVMDGRGDGKKSSGRNRGTRDHRKSVLLVLDKDGESSLPSNDDAHAKTLNGFAQAHPPISSLAKLIRDSVRESASIGKGVSVPIATALKLSDETSRDVRLIRMPRDPNRLVEARRTMTSDVGKESPDVRVALRVTQVATEDASSDAAHPLVVEVNQRPNVGEIADNDCK